LVVGGTAESLYVRPHTMDLVLKRRKGFVRIAAETGASLVPVICFGENDLFDAKLTLPGSTQSMLQK
jgi:1-acyl-sn-glycerol-3-phosphate acyltransferase